MIILKMPDEIEVMAQASRVVAEALEVVRNAVRPGVTTEDLDRIAEQAIRDRGAIPAFKGYRSYPKTLCASVNEQVVHGIPSKRKLKDGDIIGLDLGAVVGGFYGDSAVTVEVWARFLSTIGGAGLGYLGGNSTDPGRINTSSVPWNAGHWNELFGAARGEAISNLTPSDDWLAANRRIQDLGMDQSWLDAGGAHLLGNNQNRPTSPSEEFYQRKLGETGLSPGAPKLRSMMSVPYESAANPYMRSVVGGNLPGEQPVYRRGN